MYSANIIYHLNSTKDIIYVLLQSFDLCERQWKALTHGLSMILKSLSGYHLLLGGPQIMESSCTDTL